MNKSIVTNQVDNPWPHRLGVLLVCTVFPLIWIGGLVTTTDAGMAVPDWPNTYGYNLFLYPMREWFFGPWDLFVEHGHRLLASLAGLISIFIVVATWKFERRSWVLRLAWAILALVIFQGVLGGIRVINDARWIAKVHGCVGPLFFASTVAFCVVTSRWWKSQNEGLPASSLSHFANFMLLTSFSQLVLGAFLRHISEWAPPIQYQVLVVLHIATAVLLVFGTIGQFLASRNTHYRGKGIRRSIGILVILVGIQFGLGLATWVLKFGFPVWFENLPFAASFVVPEKTFWQVNIITAHVAVGSLILAFWTIHALRCGRLLSQPAESRVDQENSNISVLVNSAS